MSRLNIKHLFQAMRSNWFDLRPAPTKIALGGFFVGEVYEKDGRLLRRTFSKNGTTNTGLNDALGTYLAAGTQITTWYLGIFSDSSYSGLSASDTASSHSGWTESSAYSESVRQTWTPGSVSSQSVTNPTAASFSINATVTIKGAFLISNSTKGGTTGILWATGLFSADQALINGQTLKVTYTCSATGG